MKDYRISETQAKKLVQLRRDASESKKESIDKMLDTLKKSEFYNARYTSKQNIDKNRTRDIGKDSNRGSLTSKDEMNMTGRKFKRVSKAGHKNQYGTTEGGKVYYEYRANRRDIDHKIKLGKGGGLGKEKVFVAQTDGILGIYSGSDAYTIEISKGDKFITFGKQDDNNWWYVKMLDKQPKTMLQTNTFDYNKNKNRVNIKPNDLILTFPKVENNIYAKMKEMKYAEGGVTQQGRFTKHFNSGGKIELGDNVNVIAENKSGVVMNVISNGKQFTIQFVDGKKKVYDQNEIRKIFDEYDEFSEGGGVQKFKYERGQKFQDQYGDIILLDKYSDELWEARRWSGMRHVGDVVISEKDLDLIRTKKMAQGDLVQGRFTKHFKKGGWVLYDEDTQELINKYKTKAEAEADLYEYYGNANIVKESVWNETTEPKVDRFMFEEEMYEFKKGGTAGSNLLFDLEYGDVFKVKAKNHTASGEYFIFIDLDERYGVSLKVKPFSINSTRNDNYKFISEIKDGDIVILSREEAGAMLLDSLIDRKQFTRGGKVSEDVYYQMLGAVPPIFINTLDGKPQPNNTTFAVGEAYDFMETPMGYKAVYNAYSKKGNMYYDEGLVYFESKGVAKTLSK